MAGLPVIVPSLTTVAWISPIRKRYVPALTEVGAASCACTGSRPSAIETAPVPINSRRRSVIQAGRMSILQGMPPEMACGVAIRQAMRSNFDYAPREFVTATTDLIVTLPHRIADRLAEQAGLAPLRTPEFVSGY